MVTQTVFSHNCKLQLLISAKKGEDLVIYRCIAERAFGLQIQDFPSDLLQAGYCLSYRTQQSQIFPEQKQSELCRLGFHSCIRNELFEICGSSHLQSGIDVVMTVRSSMNALTVDCWVSDLISFGPLHRLTNIFIASAMKEMGIVQPGMIYFYR